MDKAKNEFVIDLAKVQGELKHAVLDRTNPHFRSKYASLSSVIDATIIDMALSANIILKQRTVIIDGRLWLKTWLEHPSGDQDEPSYWPIADGTPQQMGSSLTYGRRYQISLVCNIASEEDDDGEAASAPAKPKSAYQSRKEGHYPILEKGLRDQTTIDGLKEYWIENLDYIRELTPSWMEKLQEEKDRCKQKLIEEAAEDSEIKKQLKGSLV